MMLGKKYSPQEEINLRASMVLGFSFKKDDSPLTDKEEVAFSRMAPDAYRTLTKRVPSSAQEAQIFVDELVKLAGKKGALKRMMNENLIAGVPYLWCVANFFISTGLFIMTKNLMVVAFAAPLIHSIEYLFYTKTKQQRWDAKIQKITSV